MVDKHDGMKIESSDSTINRFKAPTYSSRFIEQPKIEKKNKILNVDIVKKGDVSFYLKEEFTDDG